jgi:hypothetical protein
MTYPGVYVEEVSFRNKIPRLGTTATAFIGSFADGPLNQPVRIATAAAVVDTFGSDAGSTVTGRAIAQFFANGGQSPLVVRTDGTDVAGALDALSDAVNLLVVPDTAVMTEEEARDAIAAAQVWATRRRAVYIVDAPQFGDPDDISHWAATTPMRNGNSALYYPWLTVAAHPQPPGGAVAGVYARIDEERGVWKAPAGVDAGLQGVDGLEAAVDDDQTKTLNPLGINAIRDLGAGPTIWGARTLSSDPEWKYVSVRRLSLMIEGSIQQATHWAVFEPNDAPLWATIWQATDDFLNSLWRDGALQGQNPKEAYFVRCGRDTMTQTDIDNGQLILEVGFAPLKPAEFVILRIHQRTASAPDLPGPALSRTLSLTKALGADTCYQLLFAGNAGPTKIAAARGLAAQLRRPLVRIDLDHLVSRYIGETEKNLVRLLSEAATRKSILFFDEADALFGKRTAVKSSHDRYANLEVSHLLDRIDQYRGIAILCVEKIGDRGRQRQIVKFADG